MRSRRIRPSRSSNRPSSGPSVPRASSRPPRCRATPTSASPSATRRTRSAPATTARQVAASLMAFDPGLAPIVGQQVSATSTTFSASTVTGRINLMIARANASECDLVVKGVLGGAARGWLYQPGAGQFQSDRASEPLLGEASLRAQAAVVGQELTYTAVPPGTGTRIGVDRDEDGFFDRTELDAGTDPADPASNPGVTTTTTTTVPPSTSTSTTTTTTTSTTTTIPGSTSTT